MSKSALVDVGQFATFYDSFMYFSDKLAKFPRDYFLAHRVYIDWQRYLKSKLYGVQLNELQQNSNTMVNYLPSRHYWRTSRPTVFGGETRGSVRLGTARPLEWPDFLWLKTKICKSRGRACQLYIFLL